MCLTLQNEVQEERKEEGIKLHCFNQTFVKRKIAVRPLLWTPHLQNNKLQMSKKKKNSLSNTYLKPGKK